MSRVGKKAIKLGGAAINMGENNHVVVKGPKGELALQLDHNIKLSNLEGELSLELVDTSLAGANAMHGLFRALLANMVGGVTEGYKKTLELIGVGYKADLNGSALELALGYSHSIFFVLPSEVKARVEITSDKIYMIHLESIDKQLLGQVAAKLQSLRKVEPYKGKGVRIKGQFVRRKAGKSGSKK